jgi:hypothetical protein
MRVVINDCYGGFEISPEAAIWLYERGYDDGEFKIPVGAYFGNDDHSKQLEQWNLFLKGSLGERPLDLTCFTPDGRHVLQFKPLDRAHPLLVECVLTLGVRASGRLANLVVIEIPNGVQFTIEERGGNEWISEVHRTWGK